MLHVTILRDGADMGIQVDINTGTDACTPAKEGVELEVG